MDRPEVGRDRRQRRPRLSEPGKLRMRTVALRLSLQHFLGQQGYSPKGDKTLLIHEEGWSDQSRIGSQKEIGRLSTDVVP